MDQKTTCPHCKATLEVPSEAFDTTVSCSACNRRFNPMTECVKASYDLMKTPQFRASLEARIAEANKNVTHAEFAAGAENNTIGFKCMVGNPSQLLTKPRKMFFIIFVLLYMAAPPVVLSLLAYYYHDWRLLIGIPISYFATFSAGNHLWIFPLLLFLLFCLCIGVWLRTGFSLHQYVTIYFVSAVWGYVLFEIADDAQNYYALQSLIEDPQLFKAAVEQNRIMIVRRDEQVV
jgi:hypothetical protein